MNLVFLFCRCFWRPFDKDGVVNFCRLLLRLNFWLVLYPPRRAPRPELIVLNLAEKLLFLFLLRCFVGIRQLRNSGLFLGFRGPYYPWLRFFLPLLWYLFLEMGPLLRLVSPDHFRLWFVVLLIALASSRLFAILAFVHRPCSFD